MSRNLIIASLFALLGACATDSPTPQEIDEMTLGKVQAEIRIGMSGSEVAEALGSPNMVTTDEERREVWIYDRVSTVGMSAQRSSYGTLILIGGSSSESTSATRQRTLTVIVKFDDEKKVRDFAYNYTQF